MTASRANHSRRGAARGRPEDRHADGANLHGVTRKLRCAVYTRKSSEEGLDMEFNSLDAQREACEAYITSQRGEGWVQVADRYDDGGVSGGTLDRLPLNACWRTLKLVGSTSSLCIRSTGFPVRCWIFIS
jgi:hypothetical protein